MTLRNDDIIKRIDKLQLLMLQVKPDVTCEWEIIAVEKIKKLFEDGVSVGGKYMQILNKLYTDYKYRKGLEFTISNTNELALNYRRWDLLFSEDKHDELMYKLRYEYVYGKHSEKKALAASSIKETKQEIQEIKRNLKDLNIEFDDNIDIVRIRMSKKTGDLVMVDNPLDDSHSFPAVINKSKLETFKEQYSKSHTTLKTIPARCSIDWYKQDDPSVTGSSTITDYDINTNGTLFAEEVKNLT